MNTGGSRCLGCGAERDRTKPFCSACGTLAASGVPAAPYSPFDAFSGLPIARFGPPCTVCGVTRSVPSFDGWHYLVAVLAFPAGMLVFLAPRRVCVNGHVFGSGKVAKPIGIGLVAVYALFGLLFVLWFVFIVVLGFFGAVASRPHG